jgi:UDP-glucose 4-epimerase
MDVRRSVADPMFDAEVNLIGLLNLLEGGRRNGLAQVVFASSGGTVYGDNERIPAREGDPTAPLCPYGVSKLATEHYLHFYERIYGVRYIAMRYANVYGPRQDPHGEAGVVAIFSGKMLRGEPVTVNGDGKQSRDYVYVGDVARMNALALEADATGPVNVGTSVETDVNQLAALIKAAAKSASEIGHGPAKPGEQRRSVVDVRRAAEVFGWRPEVSLAEGLGRTVEFFRQKQARG